MREGGWLRGTAAGSDAKEGKAASVQTAAQQEGWGWGRGGREASTPNSLCSGAPLTYDSLTALDLLGHQWVRGPGGVAIEGSLPE